MDGNIKVSYHRFPLDGSNVVSLSGIDVHEMADAYSASELRSIARFLENVADHLDYSNSADSTGYLFAESICNNTENKIQ